MNVIEAARRLAKTDPIVAIDNGVDTRPECVTCFEENGHEIDCPWRQMPQILAALEALGQIVTANGPYEPMVDELEGGNDGPYYQFCHGRESRGHRDGCPWDAAILLGMYGQTEPLTSESPPRDT